MAKMLALLIGALLAVTPAPLAGHDDLRSASPGDGDTLRAVPDALRLLFTREQNLALASVTLFGPDGEVPLGEMRADPDSVALVLVPVVGRWRSGEYRMQWRIVGADGHPVSGEYRFVVAEGARGLPPERVAETGAPGADRPAQGPSVSPPAENAPEDQFTVSSPLFVLVRGVGFMALLGLLGSASWTLLVVPLARRSAGGGVTVAVGAKAAGVGLASAALLLLAGLGRLWAQAAALGVGDTASTGMLGTILRSTAWGAGWWLQMVGGILAAAGLVWARRTGKRLPWVLVGVSAGAVAFAPALSGHAVGVEPLTGVAVLVDGAHVLAAGGWMGGLLLLLAVGLPPALRDEGKRTLAPLVEAFSLTALGFAAALVLTGFFSAWLHLGSLDALWSSGYGRTLGLKLLLLVPLFATGAYNWLRVRPALASGDAPARRIRLSGGVELAVAVAVILVTAVLVATPPPRDAAPRVPGSSSPLQQAPSP